MLAELSIIIILLLLAYSFYIHYATIKNIKVLFREKEKQKNEIQAIKENIQKYD